MTFEVEQFAVHYNSRVVVVPFLKAHVDSEMSNEKRAPGCLGYVGDEILPR